MCSVFPIELDYENILRKKCIYFFHMIKIFNLEDIGYQYLKVFIKWTLFSVLLYFSLLLLHSLRNLTMIENFLYKIKKLPI